MTRTQGRTSAALPALVALALLLGGAFVAWRRIGGGPTDAYPRFPKANLILISIDTLRRDALGVYNGKPDSSPILDELAKESIVFDEAIASANNTGPSHASMFTGVAPAVHGVINARDIAPQRIPNSLPTLAERLRDAGYATFARADSGYVTKTFGFDRGFDSFTSEYTGLLRKIPDAVAFLQKLPEGKPGFCFLHTYEVHSPYRVGLDRIGVVCAPFTKTEVMRRMHSVLIKSKDSPLGAAQTDLFDHWRQKFTQQDFECLKALYAECVRQVDSRIGMLVKELKASGVLDKSILVVTSDHGDQFHDHGDIQHEDIWEELLRVPLMIRLPGAALAGTHVKRLFSGVDLSPTLLDLLGLPAPSRVEGKSRIPTLETPPDDDEVVFANHTIQDMLAGDVLRTHRWKFSSYPKAENRARLYDLSKDPLEKDNIAPQMKDETAELTKTLTSHRAVWRAMSGVYAAGRETGEIDAQALEDLKTLGYTR